MGDQIISVPVLTFLWKFMFSGTDQNLYQDFQIVEDTCPAAGLPPNVL